MLFRSQLVFIETSAPKMNRLILFGAGHVGQAVVHLFKNMPWHITWVDTRDECIDEKSIANLPSSVSLCITDTPEAEIALAPLNSYFLVMTHDHHLDLELTEHILKRDDFCYFGVIGSGTKRKRFEHRLKSKGISQQQLTKMHCPIGISGIKSKQAYAIAVSVVAQLLQIAEQANSKTNIIQDLKINHVG